MSNINSKLSWYIADFPYIKNGKSYRYKSRIRASNPDSAIDKVWYDLELENLDKDYMINDLVITIHKIPDLE